MDEFIRKIQKKPEHHRRHITFGVSATATTLIFILWVTVVMPRNINSEIVAKAETERRAPTNVETPLGTIKQSAASAYVGIKNIFLKGNDSIQNINIDKEYGKIKTQVKDGDIKLIPSPTNP